MQKLVILIKSVKETFVNLIFQEIQKNFPYYRTIKKASFYYISRNVIKERLSKKSHIYI